MTEDPKDWARRAENAFSEAGYLREGARRAMLDLPGGQSYLDELGRLDRLRLIARASADEVVLHGARADCEA